MVTSGRSGLEVIVNEESLFDLEFFDLEYCISAPLLIPIPSEQQIITSPLFISFSATNYYHDNISVGGINTTEGEPRLFMETDSIPSVSTTVRAFEHLLLDNNYAAFENVADDIDDWRNQLVARLNIYAAKINDIQDIANSVVSNRDATNQSFSSVSARLDHFSKLIDGQNERISDKSLKIQSLA